jgi:hypothetical protein
LNVKQGYEGTINLLGILIEQMSQTDRVQTSVYFPKEVYAALVKWAEEEDRSVSNLVVRLVTRAIEEKESK